MPHHLKYCFLGKCSFTFAKNGITTHKTSKIAPGLVVQKYVSCNYFLQTSGRYISQRQ